MLLLYIIVPVLVSLIPRLSVRLLYVLYWRGSGNETISNQVVLECDWCQQVALKMRPATRWSRNVTGANQLLSK